VKTIFYSSARCGAGKTHWAIKRLSEAKGRSVLAVDRQEVAVQRADAIRLCAEQAGLHPNVQVIVSDEDEGVRHANVARRIEDAAMDLANDPHVVLIVCHAGLRLADLSGFAGWNLIIDEAIGLLEHRVEETGAMLAWLEANYELGREVAVVGDEGAAVTQFLPEPDGSYAIRFKGAFTKGDISKRGSRDWLNFHQMVLTNEARCDVGTWREKVRWSAWRRLDPSAHLAAFDEISILADSFAETETYLLLAQDPAVTLVEIAEIKANDAARNWRQRDVRIEFFLDERPVSDSLLKGSAFRPHLKAIGRYIAKNSKAEDHLWSCNDAQAALLRKCGIPGDKVQPVQAGSNSFADITCVSMLYSAKPTPEAKALFGKWGVTEAQLVAAREYGAIRQFVMRSSARVPDSVKPLIFRVMDRAQADDLERYLTSAYGFIVALEHIDLGIEVANTAKIKARKSKPLTVDEKRERQAGYAKKYRDKNKIEPVAAMRAQNLPPA
jgi:hypothetical protein